MKCDGVFSVTFESYGILKNTKYVNYKFYNYNYKSSCFVSRVILYLKYMDLKAVYAHHR